MFAVPDNFYHLPPTDKGRGKVKYYNFRLGHSLPLGLPGTRRPVTNWAICKDSCKDCIASLDGHVTSASGHESISVLVFLSRRVDN